MGRRKLEMKRIEDKSSRQVTFSKRRAGLVKKARQLSVLCDVDVAVIVFSARGKLYESCSGGTNSVQHILSRYEKSCLEEEKRTIQRGAGNELRFHCQSTRYRICDELLQSVNRLVEEQNADKLSVTDMTELEEELDAALVQTRSRKTQLMMDYISTLHEKENKLSDEKDKMEKQVVSAKKHDGGGGLNDLATNQTNPPEPLVTLPLFKD